MPGAVPAVARPSVQRRLTTAARGLSQALVAQAEEDLARRVVAAFNARDPGALAALVSEDFEWITPTADGAEAKTYRGNEGIHRFFEEASRWQVIEDRVEDILDLGQQLLVLGEVRWRTGRRGSLEVRAPLAAVLQVRDGRLSRIQTYRSASRALQAAQAPAGEPEASGCREASALARAH